MNGNLPKRVIHFVEEWRSKNIKLLQNAWEDAAIGKTPKKIKPLD
jgi:hypothetical protein